MVFEPPCTERYARWCERSTAQIMSSLLLDLWWYSLIFGDDYAGADATVIAADKLLEALDIRIAQTDAAFGGHRADRSGVMRTVNADAYPAGVQRKEPGAVGTFDYALAVTEIVRPVMRRANLLDAEGNLR